jgi:hypothetical protein
MRGRLGGGDQDRCGLGRLGFEARWVYRLSEELGIHKIHGEEDGGGDSACGEDVEWGNGVEMWGEPLSYLCGAELELG